MVNLTDMEKSFTKYFLGVQRTKVVNKLFRPYQTKQLSHFLPTIPRKYISVSKKL